MPQSSLPLPVDSSSGAASDPAPTSNSGTNDSDGWSMPDYVHTLLLWTCDGSTRVLMLRQDSTDTWDLPYFIYPNSLGYNADRFAADLERRLSIPTLPHYRAFAVVAELLGEHGGEGLTNDDPIGFARLMLVESQIALCDLPLPPNAEWKDAHFVSSLLKSLDERRGNRPALEVTLEYLTSFSDRVALHRDPRYQFGWFQSAANWLRTEGERHGTAPIGRVIQVQVSPSSTVLSLECCTETFYLKAPELGSEEISITATVASLFPESTVHVLSTSEELHSFIMRGFDDIEPDEAQYKELVKSLATIQLESLHHLETLKASGCEERGPVQIAEKVLEWTNDEVVKEIFGCRFPYLIRRAPMAVDLCSKLATYNIPLTLVHGDFATRNASVVNTKGDVGGHACPEGSDTLRDSGADDSTTGIMLFDWQYACISHPFFDLHEMHWELSEDVLNAYLDMWSVYENRERALEALKIARELGWCLKSWTSLDCYRQCNLQRISSTAEFVYCTFSRIGFSVVGSRQPSEQDSPPSRNVVAES